MESMLDLCGDTATTEGNPEDYPKSQFPDDWVIVDLNYPLRTSKIISENVKRGRVDSYLHTNNFNPSLKLTQNMPLGPEPLMLLLSKGSYHTRIKHVFSTVGKGRSALIILDYLGMKPSMKEIKEAKKTASNVELVENSNLFNENFLVGIEAVKACQRSSLLPLLWFNSKFSHISDDKETVKEWMKGQGNNFIVRDLITDDRCVAGYEANFVIYLGSSGNVSAMMSRCRGQFVHIE